jgi:hypothetical protein
MDLCVVIQSRLNRILPWNGRVPAALGITKGSG